MSKIIGILGCGWLGFPLAKSFLQEDYSILGSTSTKEKIDCFKDAGIIPFVISLEENIIKGNIDSFLNSITVLIIAIPPKLNRNLEDSYVKKMQLLHVAIKNNSIKKIVFISSISIYGNASGSLTENTIPRPETESAKQLLIAENIFSEDTTLQTTIIRFGGLIGKDRRPINRLSGKVNLPNGNFPVNLIHLNDCISLVKAVVKNDFWNEIINGVNPNHPSKKEYYQLEAIKRELKPPTFITNELEGGKTIISVQTDRLKNFAYTSSICTK
ncbi:MAG: SDR family NAD(P)-dependent oxidoreductase [Cellulophaga sp.]